MNSIPISTTAETSADDLTKLRDSWGWFLTLGLIMVGLGSVAIGWACLTTITVAATWIFGLVLLAGGIAELVHAFSAARWTGTLLHIWMGVLYSVVGVVILDRPEESAILLTRLIAVFLVISGLFRIVTALAQNFPSRGFVLFNGVVTLLLGVLIYNQWPTSGLWFIGLYIGIEMILNGWAWFALGLGLKRWPAATV